MELETDLELDPDLPFGEVEEIDEAFDACTAHVAAIAGGKELSQDDKLALYGFYKQAIEGPCTTFRPSFFDRVARAKWAAWKQLGSMPSEAAKVAYVGLLCKLQPNFTPIPAKGLGGGSKGGPMGPVFSCMAAEGVGPSEVEANLGPEVGSLHILASQGDVRGMEALLRAGADVNARDSEGCSALHWAGDRGSEEAIQLLLRNGADVEARDADGLTPLHYAALCERQEACEVLLRAGAIVDARGKDGETAQEKGPPSWTFWPT